MGPSPQSAEWHHSSVHAFPSLPGDIIAQVCKQIFATPLHQYDLSLTRGPHSQWAAELRFRISLPLVSKLWWQPATRGLYKHIVIRRFRQIPALARTLLSKDAGIDFGALVRKVTLHECLVFLPDWNVACEDLRTVFERCVALEEFSFQRHPDCKDTTSEGDYWPGLVGANPIWIFPQIIFPALQAHAPTSLRKLDLGSRDCWERVKLPMTLVETLHGLILASPRLTTLAIQDYEILGPAPGELPTLEFLEELLLDFQGIPPKPSPPAVWAWHLPRLRSLTVVLDRLPIPTIVLEQLGRTLTYLHLSGETPRGGPELDRLSQLCPALEHLVFCPPYAQWRRGSPHAPFTLPDASAEPFRRLRHLDIWLWEDLGRTGWSAADAASLVARARASFAPALEGVRALLVLAWPLPPDVPTICHPAMVTRADDARFVCVRDVWMVQTAWCVRCVGDWWMDEGMWLEDESGDYDPNVRHYEDEDESEDDGTS